MHEDTMTATELYDVVFPLSKVDGVRLFPKEIEAKEECEWEYDDSTDSWDTECDNKHLFICDGIKENGYEYCPYCGANIKQID